MTSVLMAFTVIIGYRKYCLRKNTPLLRVFYVDGTLYFVTVAVISMANILMSSLINIVRLSPTSV